MKQRTITAALIVVIFIPLLIFEKMLIPYEIALGVLAMIGAYELVKMFEKDHQLTLTVKIAIYIFTAGFFVIVGNVWHTRPDVALGDLSRDASLIYMLALLTLFSLTIFIPSFNSKTLGAALTIILYIGLGFGSLNLLRLLGSRYIVYLLIITVLTDTFAFLFGVKFGKHKMAPNISPKKSWEGAIAGTTIATIIASLFALFYGFIFPEGTFFNKGGGITLLQGVTNFGLVDGNPVLWQHALIIVPLTMVISIFGQLGDLFASKLKRSHEIKDYGNLFPGHGGVMDRFDSAIFAATFLVFILQLFGLIWV